MEHVTQRKLYKRMTIVVKTSIDEKSKGKRSLQKNLDSKCFCDLKGFILQKRSTNGLLVCTVFLWTLLIASTFWTYSFKVLFLKRVYKSVGYLVLVVSVMKQ